jgi:hypothetical protein
MIHTTDNKVVNYEGPGEYLLIESQGIYIKAKCMAVINLEKKHNRPVIYLDETNVKTFDHC